MRLVRAPKVQLAGRALVRYSRFRKRVEFAALRTRREIQVARGILTQGNGRENFAGQNEPTAGNYAADAFCVNPPTELRRAANVTQVTAA
jgi:hypothetical protein